MGLARWLRLLGILGFILALYFLVPVNTEPPTQVVVRGLLGVLLLVALAAGLRAQLRLAALDGDRRIDGLVAAIVTVLVAFAFAFYALQVHQPDQVEGLHTRVDGLYFSASTMLTIGYGDVHAVGQAARIVVLVQMVFDVVFVATAASLLASKVRRAAARHAAAAGPDWPPS
ncbi:potassium channel family protein [Nocardioides sp. W7]|uniref:potassium channel family protein n=1 Tax=Nocardioides sp. W7 TaxID=2931390 RepID=UPI001FD05724|nr:potassium channel family protein [Nocardioides sp. W7]